MKYDVVDTGYCIKLHYLHHTHHSSSISLLLLLYLFLVKDA